MPFGRAFLFKKSTFIAVLDPSFVKLSIMNSITTRFKAVCEQCHHHGAYIRIIDAHGYVQAAWEGFSSDQVAPNATRAKQYAALMKVKCPHCGSEKVTVGEPQL